MERLLGTFRGIDPRRLLERTLEMTLKNHQIDASPEKIREALNSLQVSLLNIDNEQYYLKGK